MYWTMKNFGGCCEGGVEENDESVHGTEDQPRLDCEGIFGNENPPQYDDDGDKLMCLESVENRDPILKRLGNSKHKPFNNYALVDGFVVRKEWLVDVVTVRAKVLAKEKRIDDQINIAVDYFVCERNKRRKIMLEQTAKEQNGEMLHYEKESWENREYLDYMKELASQVSII